MLASAGAGRTSLELGSVARLVADHVDHALHRVVHLRPAPLARLVRDQPLLLVFILSLVQQLLLQGRVLGLDLLVDHLAPVDLRD